MLLWSRFLARDFGLTCHFACRQRCFYTRRRGLTDWRRLNRLDAVFARQLHLLSCFSGAWAFMNSRFDGFRSGRWCLAHSLRHRSIVSLDDWLRRGDLSLRSGNDLRLLLTIRATRSVLRAILAGPIVTLWRGLRCGNWRGRFLTLWCNDVRPGLRHRAYDLGHGAFVSRRNDDRKLLFAFAASESGVRAFLPVSRFEPWCGDGG